MTANGANQNPPEPSPRRTRNRYQEPQEAKERAEATLTAPELGNPVEGGESLGSDLGNSAPPTQHAPAREGLSPPEPTNWALIQLAVNEPKIAAALIVGIEKAHLVVHPQLSIESLDLVINQLIRLVSQLSVNAARAGLGKAQSSSETDPPVAP